MKERGSSRLRFFDRYIGIPLLPLLYLLRKKRKKPRSVMGILAIKISTIGDMLLLMPVLKSIKDRYPQAHLTVVCSRNNHDIASRYHFVDSVKVFEVGRALRQPSYFFRFMSDVNKRPYDAVIDFESWPRISAILASSVGTGYRIGFATKGEARGMLFDAAVWHSKDRHEMDNYGVLANTIGVSLSERYLRFPVKPDEEMFVSNMMDREGISADRLIIFHPWSSGYKGHFKEWGIGNFAGLAGALIRGGYSIGITGAKDNDAGAEEIARAYPGKITSFCGRLTLGQTAALIRKSRLLITVNTGIMHLGAALNHPMITLNGPAGILRWGPAGQSNVYNIESDYKCAPCLNLGFEYKCKEGGCMDSIKVETVVKRAREILARKQKW